MSNFFFFFFFFLVHLSTRSIAYFSYVILLFRQFKCYKNGDITNVLSTLKGKYKGFNSTKYLRALQ